MRWAVVMLIGVLGACADDDDGLRSMTDGAVVTYRYDDASVPPEYHRSYMLTITADGAHLVVDSYGEILQDVERPLPDGVWEQVRDTDLDAFAVPNGPDVDDGCAGGTARRLRVLDRGTTLIDVEAAACGDDGDDTVGAIDALVQPVKDAIGDWDELLA